jgi:hypothetical protein
MAQPWEQYAQQPQGDVPPWQKYGASNNASSTATNAPPQPATLRPASPAQHPVQDWLHNLDTDITEGGNRTLPGRILGHMQGRGDEGYAGMREGGQSTGVINFMGSPVRGPIHAAEGVAETPEHPVMGPVHAIEGAAETATIPSLMMGGEGLNAGIEAIPSRAHAVSVLKDIESAAKDVPVSMSKTQHALEEFGQSVKTGGKNAPVMTKLTKRLEAPGLPQAGIAPPNINFPEARDFYTNISRASAKPGFLRRAIESPMMPSFRMEAGGVRTALHGDLTDAAGTIGRGQDYADAIKEYAQNARLRGFLKKGAMIAAPAAAGAVGAGRGYQILRNLSR